MRKDEFNSKSDFSLLLNASKCYLEKIYQQFLINPNSVEQSWRAFFSTIFSNTHSNHKLKLYNNKNYKSQENIIYIASNIIKFFRRYGHKFSNLDPLNLTKREFCPTLESFLFDMDIEIINKKFLMKLSQFSFHNITLKKLYSTLYAIYCNSIGYEYMHINCQYEKTWIQNYIERDLSQHTLSNQEKKNLLQNLISAETLEKYFASKFPGSKRFSLEGSESLIPMLQETIHYATKMDINKIILGMSHRGRLNVLINVLNKPIKDIFNEFSEIMKKYNSNSGDVKYHMGFNTCTNTKFGKIYIDLKFNPSHLEIVNSVVIGSVRAHQDSIYEHNKQSILALLIHGDSAISGQGIVQETLNMSQTRGYKINGTIHIVLNNQIGFTTSNLKDMRSSKYCTDIAKMIDSPIFHVNSDDPEAILFVIRLALDFKNNFQKDVFIDLICYRRHGHNEIDDPYITQPIMYSKINKHPTICKIYSKQLIKKNIIHHEYLNDNVTKYKRSLDERYLEYINKTQEIRKNILYDNNIYTNPIQVTKNISEKKLKELAKKINIIPSNISVHDQVLKIYKNRLKMVNENKLLDWGAAETLAYASLLNQGISCRLSGEDVGRGTFSHRHATIYDQKNGSLYIPLQHIHSEQGKFYIWDSTLSEEAVLAFEYGYSISQNNTLTIWEAQFGDFANGAQIVIDQFICSSEQKWGVTCNLVMLLPHGYEGQGPEHSSARLERYLQLSAENNIQICIPTTASQMYHLLCRQSFHFIKKPLIIMTPKSLLRHPLSSSPLLEFWGNTFQEVINEIDNIDTKIVKRIIFCSGKVYYDLLNQRRKNQQTNITILRIEQLYPFPSHTLSVILQSYLHISDFIWCQEEPFNQGAWLYIQYHLKKILPKQSRLNYVGRPESSSTATGYISIHKKQQQRLVNDALNVS